MRTNGKYLDLALIAHDNSYLGLRLQCFFVTYLFGFSTYTIIGTEFMYVRHRRLYTNTLYRFHYKYDHAHYLTAYSLQALSYIDRFELQTN